MMTTAEQTILELLLDNGEMYWLEMVKSSAGLLRRHSICGVLLHMADKGHIESHEEEQEGEDELPHLLFRITELGARIFHRSAGDRADVSSPLQLAYYVWSIQRRVDKVT